MDNKLNRNLGLILVLSLVIVFSTFSVSFGSRQVSITVTINIEPFQQLTLESKDDAVSVSGSGEEAVSSVELDSVDSSTVELNPAVAATVRSNVNWKLLAHTEDSYVVENDTKDFSSGPSLDLKIPNEPNGVEGKTSWFRVGSDSSVIAQGSPGSYGPFDVFYELGFNGQDEDDIDGAGVDVVYTMMEL